MQSVARLEYQRPALTLTTILQASNLDELVSSVAQARLVARKQQTLYAQARTLREQDSRARDEAARQLSQIAAKRNQAAGLAGRTQSMLRSAQTQEQQRQAQALNQYAEAASRTPAPGSGATVPNTFVAGQCTWYVANLRNIPWTGNAIEWWPNARKAGFAEGPTPQVGAVMVTRESGYGHVSLVQSVNGDSWTVTEMNYHGPFQVSSRTLRPGQAPVVGFIYGKAS
jgi:surface antigen